MRVFSLIGYPLDYTLSPQIHNYVFRKLNIEAVYVPLRVTSKRLPHFIEFSRDALSGFNVTIPHKVTVAKLIDELNDDANAIKSVNTVVNSKQELIGYNTDYVAIKESLIERGYNGEEALLIGAGGAARAVVLALSKIGCKTITVLNRSRERAVELCGLANGLGLDCNAVDIGGDYGKPHLVVNATPLSSEEDWLLDLSRLGVAILIDMAYKPKGETSLIKRARELGIRAIDGVEILVRQALAADKLWLGDFNEPSIDEVIRYVKGNEA
ncbi:shikimate dehydrogenase family protein [Caldivirga sp. UBA161]|uniref:shikimate dehydrogenase family protein n=1 Tax=Caldivirga sp. UBA161 TaxID=1915569 RepID=UPI0025C2C08E|nr:shikimate dehydrogenase [Caldivirga sp. UBA161]